MENMETNCEKIWKIRKISVLVIIIHDSYLPTPPLPAPPPPPQLPFRPPPPPPSMHAYILFSRIEKNHLGIVFCRDYASRDQIYHFIHLILRLLENCEMIWKIRNKPKLNSDKIWKIQEENCEMIWKIWKKNKLNSEIIWKI